MDTQMIVMFKQLGQFVVMLLVGFSVIRLKWLDRDDFGSISKLLVKVLLPLYLLTTIPAAGTRADLVGSLPLIALAALALLILIAFGIFSGRLVRLQDGAARSHAVCNGITNIGFMGIPLGAALFGAPGILAASMFTVANDMLMWSLGRGIMLRSVNIGFAASEWTLGGAKPKTSLKGLINFNLIGVVAGCLLLALEVNPAGNLVWDTLTGISSMCRFLPMIIIGGMLATFDFRSLRRYLPILIIVFSKLLIVPAVFALLIAWLMPGMSDINFKMLILGIALPTFATSAAAASTYGADAQYAAACTTLTTLASLVTLPLVFALLGLF